MNSSIFDIFKIGIGPSSSHTVGPMIIANKFVSLLKEKNFLTKIQKLEITLYGSLAATGLGHSSDVAVLLGFTGKTPQNIDTDFMNIEMSNIKKNKKLKLLDNFEIDFDYEKDLILKLEFLEFHSNAIKFKALGKDGILVEKTYYSIGGGFVLCEDEIHKEVKNSETSIPYSFNSSKELISLCKKNNLKISELVMENEKVLRSEEEIKAKLKEIWKVMQSSVKNGCENEGLMPGRLKVPRRAKKLYEKLSCKANFSMVDPLEVMDWIDLYALAVNEENACGGRVVTAPTNGAAGIIPAVIHYMNRFLNKNLEEFDMEAINSFLLTAGAIGMLYQKNASISGADVGCQGEVGVACSMAAGALAELMGADVDKVENAAEIGYGA